ncbi:MAG: MFS transporter [Snodgrassella sp.]|uniref:MFS transporter n=1 Tax=Snodgrassella alvi TaxID=1196083 RepID=A0A066THT5_9NEIS|nr:MULTISPECIES: MFS transporter [Snodgrassella]KDN13077.1 Major facilitator superfamily (MFS) transport protein [Snodgrassella communis]MCO6506743.1 MFS transporter [Snodgrassella sp.]MCO6507491.1 MFS transporter [Snodgrassella sp.]MCO6514281.1 MFS transporter [Snodgrassella sp.]MCO6517756.1 MFS transporter [Snodgrassella sp.]
MNEARKKLTPAKAMVAAISGYAMDGFDLLILGFMLSAISNDLGLNTSQAGSLVTWTLIGSVIGGIVFGHLSDRFGRVRMLSLTILMFAVFTGLCAIAQGYYDLLIYRALAGMGLGGEFGIGMAMIAEVWPAAKRNRASAYVGIGWQLGVLAAAFITPFLLNIIGWRGMFLVGLFPAVASYFIRHDTSEPEQFTREHKAKGELSFTARLGLLVKDWQTAKTSLGIFILCAVQNFGYYGLMIWMPSYLASKLGFSLTASGNWTAVTVIGMIIGIWLFGFLADHFARWKIFLIYQIGSFIMVAQYAQLQNPTALLICGAIMGLFVNGMIGGYGALISDNFPPHVRATAQNVLFNLGRGVGGFGPLVIGFFVKEWSFYAALCLLASIYLLDIIATLWLLPRHNTTPSKDDNLGVIG